MDDKLGELLHTIEDKLISIDSWGRKVCIYCEAEEYAVDVFGRDIGYINAPKTWIYDHLEDCIISDIAKFKKSEGQ